jgi:PhnB protein
MFVVYYYISKPKKIMTQINTYIAFDGRCEEAMNFYKECLGGELEIQIVKDSPIKDQCPSAMQDQVLHASLNKGSLLLMGSDMSGPGGYVKGNNVSLSLSCSSEEEVNTFFSNLSAGGQVIDPLGVKFWGATFGVLNDKYGIRWMLIYDKNQQ